MARNGQKWSKMAKNDQKWQNMDKIWPKSGEKRLNSARKSRKIGQNPLKLRKIGILTTFETPWTWWGPSYYFFPKNDLVYFARVPGIHFSTTSGGKLFDFFDPGGLWNTLPKGTQPERFGAVLRKIDFTPKKLSKNGQILAYFWPFLTTWSKNEIF